MKKEKTNKRDQTLTILLPTYNEEEGLSFLSKELKETIKNISENKKLRIKSIVVLVVDSKSKDNTLEIAKKIGARTIITNRGKGRAVSHALRKIDSDYLIMRWIPTEVIKQKT